MTATSRAHDRRCTSLPPGPAVQSRTRRRILPAGMMLSVVWALSLPLSGCRTKPPSPRDEPDRLVVAHVMHQLCIGAEPHPHHSILSVEPSRPNGVMALHTPEYLPYYRRPIEATAFDVAMMKKGGIDAMALLFNAIHLDSQFASVIHAYYRAAEDDGRMRIFPDIWDPVNDGGDHAERLRRLGESLGELLRLYPEVWLKRDGRLVVSLYTHHGFRPMPDVASFTEELFASVGGRENVYLVLHSPIELKEHNPDWFAAADAFTDFPSSSYARTRHRLRQMYDSVEGTGKTIWCPIMPSFFQSRYPHNGGTFKPNVREKLGVTSFRDAWLTAMEKNAPAAFCYTWNDLTEDHAIMPESNHKDAFYILHRYFGAWFQRGRPPEIERERILCFHHPRVVEGLALPPGVEPIEGFPVSAGEPFRSRHYHRTPPTDYVQVVTMLKAPATIRVLFGETPLAEREMPAGVNFWLIYQPRSLNDPRGLYDCDPEQVYPREENGFFVTRVDHPRFPIGHPDYEEGFYSGFPDSEVYLFVERDGRRIGVFRSHQPIRAAAGRDDMTVIGNVFPLARAGRAP
jgi:hypothetical protein